MTSTAVAQHPPISTESPLVSLHEASEAELIRLAVGGDDDAFSEIVQRNQNVVFKQANKFGRRRADVEDIAQEVFKKVYFALKNFNGRSSLSTWIHTIARNEAFDYLRGQRNSKVVYEGDMTESASEIIGDSELSADKRPPVDVQLAKRDYLLKLLEKISAKDRTLLIQKEVEGYTIPELSRMTGIKENTLKVKLFRARQKLVDAAEDLEAAGKEALADFLASSA